MRRSLTCRRKGSDRAGAIGLGGLLLGLVRELVRVHVVGSLELVELLVVVGLLVLVVLRHDARDRAPRDPHLGPGSDRDRHLVVGDGRDGPVDAAGGEDLGAGLDRRHELRLLEAPPPLGADQHEVEEAERAEYEE